MARRLQKTRDIYADWVQGLGNFRITEIGDSVGEGYNAGVSAHTTNMMTSACGLAIAATRGDSHCGLYLPTTITSGWPEGADPWTRTSGPAQFHDAGGIGDRTCLFTPGNRLEITAPAWATHVMIHTRNSGSSFNVMDVKSNGSTIGTLTYTSGDGTDHVQTFALTGSGNLFRLTMTAGLGWTYVHGVTWLNTNTNYLAVFEGGHGGYGADEWANSNGAGGMIDPVVATNPDLIIMDLGGNDLLLGRTQAAFQADLETIISQIDAKMSGNLPDYLFVVNPYVNPFRAAGLTVSQATFNAYMVDTNKDVADALGDRARCLNLGAIFGPFDPSVGVEDIYVDGHLWVSSPAVTDGRAGDWAHPTAYGHSRMGGAIAEVLTEVTPTLRYGDLEVIRAYWGDTLVDEVAFNP